LIFLVFLFVSFLHPQKISSPPNKSVRKFDPDPVSVKYLSISDLIFFPVEEDGTEQVGSVWAISFPEEEDGTEPIRSLWAFSFAAATDSSTKTDFSETDKDIFKNSSFMVRRQSKHEAAQPGSSQK